MPGTDSLPRQIAVVREFNRFYTARLGLLRKRHLGGEFSLTEARLLYEIGSNAPTTASAVRATLELDAGYMSRLLAALVRHRLIRQTASRTDAREKQTTLTLAGQRAVARINQNSNRQLEDLLQQVNAQDREILVHSLAQVRRILSGPESQVRIERLPSITPDALAILDEYYGAVHVVQRDTRRSVRKLLEEPGSGMWLAWLDGQVVGCVVLRRLADLPLAGECKRLYVKPAARGNRIGSLLLDAMEDFARSQGLRWVYLDSYHDLRTAIALYKSRGYKRCGRYNDNPQATLFMRKRLSQSPR